MIRKTPAQVIGSDQLFPAAPVGNAHVLTVKGGLGTAPLFQTGDKFLPGKRRHTPLRLDFVHGLHESFLHGIQNGGPVKTDVIAFSIAARPA